jgi:hypothetical protein
LLPESILVVIWAGAHEERTSQTSKMKTNATTRGGSATERSQQKMRQHKPSSVETWRSAIVEHARSSVHKRTWRVTSVCEERMALVHFSQSPYT